MGTGAPAVSAFSPEVSRGLLGILVVVQTRRGWGAESRPVRTEA